MLLIARTHPSFLNFNAFLVAHEHLVYYECLNRPGNLRRSVDSINAKLRGTKSLDLFECARVDPEYPIEDQMKTLSTLQKEGKFDHIGLSECSAATVERANAVSLKFFPLLCGRALVING